MFGGGVCPAPGKRALEASETPKIVANFRRRAAKPSRPSPIAARPTGARPKVALFRGSLTGITSDARSHATVARDPNPARRALGTEMQTGRPVIQALVTTCAAGNRGRIGRRFAGVHTPKGSGLVWRTVPLIGTRRWIVSATHEPDSRKAGPDDHDREHPASIRGSPRRGEPATSAKHRIRNQWADHTADDQRKRDPLQPGQSRVLTHVVTSSCADCFDTCRGGESPARQMY